MRPLGAWLVRVSHDSSKLQLANNDAVLRLPDLETLSLNTILLTLVALTFEYPDQP